MHSPSRSRWPPTQLVQGKAGLDLATSPGSPIERGFAGPGLLAETIVRRRHVTSSVVLVEATQGARRPGFHDLRDSAARSDRHALVPRRALAWCHTIRVGALSRQPYAPRDKILEVDALLTAGDRVFEVHPEVSFAALAEKLGRKRVLPSKKTWGGLTVRLGLLREVGIVLPDDIGPAGLAGIDDLVDAAVAAWSAERIVRGEAKTLPAEPEWDVRGRAVASWY